MARYACHCEEMARAAGEVLLQWRGKFSVREKAPSDLVTEADMASQELIYQRLKVIFPTHRFVGEEQGFPAPEALSMHAEEIAWVVDPLDGTTNYVHDLPGWCVSIGVVQGEQVIAGCVYDPLHDICYTAEKGAGAFCNGKPITTSKSDSLSNGLIAVSFPVEVNENSPEIRHFLDLLPKIRAFRRLGSAALNLCHVAAGQLDGYWASQLHPWDIAAGTLLVEEAGGKCTSAEGKRLNIFAGCAIVAGNTNIHSELLQAVSGQIL